jgi:hypothetical protein
LIASLAENDSALYPKKCKAVFIYFVFVFDFLIKRTSLRRDPWAH